MEITDCRENEISFLVRKCIFKVYNAFGPGLLEKFYIAAMVQDLRKEGLKVKTEVPIPVIYDGYKLGLGFRADIVIDDKVIVEVKSIDQIAAVHHKMLITYLRVANLKLGILVNFSSANIAESIYRKVNGL